MEYDLHYTQGDMFTAFLPNTLAGEEAWRELAAQTENTGKVFNSHAKSTIQQLRDAGYTVRKAPPVKPLSADDIDSMLSELDL